MKVRQMEPGEETSLGDELVASLAEGLAILRGEVPPARRHVPPLAAEQDEADRDGA